MSLGGTGISSIDRRVNGGWGATYHDDKFYGRGYGGTLVIELRRDAK